MQIKRFIKKILRRGTIRLVPFFLYSCSSQYIELTLDDQTDLLEKVTQVTQYKSQELYLNSVVFKSDIKDGDEIGKAFTGFSNKETPIRLNRSVERYFESEFNDALNIRSMKLKTGNLDFVGVIKKFWIEEVKLNGKEHSKCNVKLDIYLNKSDGFNAWKGHYYSEILAKGTLGDTTSNNSRTLKTCVNEIFEQIFRDKKFQVNTKMR